MHFTSPWRGLMWLGAVVVLAAGGAVAFFLSLDFDGKPYNVRNDCASAIYVDNGHDGLTILIEQTVEVAGFGGDLDLRIGRPTGDLGPSVAFTSSEVKVDGALCP